MHSSARNAFKAINDTAIARVDSQGSITFLKNHPKKQERKLNLKLMDPKLKVGILKAHPNMSAKEISNYNSFDALILEGTGFGHFPINKIDNFTKENEKIYGEIKRLAKKIPLIATSQTIQGKINLNIYSTGRLLQEAGVIGNNLDIITETAFIKIAWLLSNFPKNKVRELFNEDFHGEISKRVEPDFSS